MLIKNTIAAIGAASVVLLGGALVLVPTASAATTAGTTPASANLASSYSSFAGSQTNAESLVNGLRTSSAITLTSSAGAPAASFSPATGKMGYGNINIALALSQTALAKQGITSPTPAQLAAALSGILGQRAGGLGWGQIANGMGVKLGDVVSASKTDKSGNKADRTSTAGNVSKSAQASTGRASGKEAGSTGKSGSTGNAGGIGSGSGRGGGTGGGIGSGSGSGHGGGSGGGTGGGSGGGTGGGSGGGSGGSEGGGSGGGGGGPK